MGTHTDVFADAPEGQKEVLDPEPITQNYRDSLVTQQGCWELN